MLIDRLIELAHDSWKSVFAQHRTLERALQAGIGSLIAVGRRTITNSIQARNATDSDWSADYKVFSRSPWSEADLFDASFTIFLERYPGRDVPVALDETKLHKTGRRIPHAAWQRDPLSPPFHTNLIWGLRFLQASVLYPHHTEGELPARGIPVAFVDSPAVKRPGSRASDQEWKAYRLEQRERNLSRDALDMIVGLRSRLDRLGGSDRTLVMSMDGSFCNRTVFRSDLDRVTLLARTRKDARLCLPAAPSSRRKYEPNTFTPEQVRLDESIPWQSAQMTIGAVRHEFRYKELSNVLWRSGAALRPLRLIVIAPQPYRTKSCGGKDYRRPAFLLTTDHLTPAAVLIQIYIDRWQIEVNHREEKDLLGVGQAQVWSEQSVARQPAFIVALYSLLMLASLLEFGPGRTSAFAPLPPWRKHATRPSVLDLIHLVRRELIEAQVSPPGLPISASTLVSAAHT
jgi:hypothetical protein